MNLKHCLVAGWLILPATLATAQDKVLEKAPENWFNLDFSDNNVRGVSTEKAYKTLLKGKKSQTVVVGVIDSGIEIDHEDLKDKIWVNEKEKNGKPGVDDDGNGYIDDINGWDFLGGKDGKDISQDSYEATREYKRLKAKYEDKNMEQIAEADKKEFAYYEEVKKHFESKSNRFRQEMPQIKGIYDKLQQSKTVLKEHLKKDDFTMDDVKSIKSNDDKVTEAKNFYNYLAMLGIPAKDLEEYYEYLKKSLDYGYNLDFDPRSIVGDDYQNTTEKGYGNNEVEGPDAEHGTHVAGIIGADRNNGKGMTGVADNVKIMVLRAVPDGDERDKDIANAIRYAVDNGAKVINMSFGKDFSPEKKAVDEAVKYAEKKGVLLVHAAGNDGEDIDINRNFPTKNLLDGTQPKNWIEVGASDWGKNGNFVADFSNYGQKTVDVFAPGVDLYSAIPDQKYKDNSGTSMAAPVVSGVAALLMSYYPNLTAEDVKDIILKSSVKYADRKVNRPGTDPNNPEAEPTIEFGKLSNTGGIVNAFEALKMAEQVSKKKKK
ncbi:MAG: S8 family peptidase [Microscillaceae bacterium]|jgi:subtilisin family serine protease|nr:S8 family peptidase [Microscillaceae bacterium]